MRKLCPINKDTFDFAHSLSVRRGHYCLHTVLKGNLDIVISITKHEVSGTMSRIEVGRCYITYNVEMNLARKVTITNDSPCQATG